MCRIARKKCKKEKLLKHVENYEKKNIYVEDRTLICKGSNKI